GRTCPWRRNFRIAPRSWGNGDGCVPDEKARVNGATVADAQRRASVVLPATTAAPRSARHFTARTMQRWGVARAVERAELIVSELVTNAIRHGHTTSRLVLRSDDRCLRIEVVDFGAGGAVRRHPAPDDVGGRGLLLVEAMTDRWGTVHDGHEHTVWCEIGL